MEILTGVVPPTNGKVATILPTGRGWLRVRSTPGLTGDEVTKVDVGNEYKVLEEGSGWIKIQIDETTEGWVYATYIDIVEE